MTQKEQIESKLLLQPDKDRRDTLSAPEFILRLRTTEVPAIRGMWTATGQLWSNHSSFWISQFRGSNPVASWLVEVTSNFPFRSNNGPPVYSNRGKSLCQLIILKYHNRSRQIIKFVAMLSNKWWITRERNSTVCAGELGSRVGFIHNDLRGREDVVWPVWQSLF